MFYFLGLIIGLLLITRHLAKRYSYSDALLLVVSVAIAFDWSITIGERMRPTMNDVVFIVCCIVWAIKLLQTGGHIRLPAVVIRVVLPGVLLFGWAAATWIVHPGNESFLFGGWRSTRLFVHIVYLFLGAQLALASKPIQYKVVHLILYGGILNSVIGFIQTATGGRYLHGFWTNGRYLGLSWMPPLPARQLLSRTKGITLEPYQFENRLERASGTTLHSDWFAPYVVLLGCLWLGFALRAKSNRDRLFYLAGSIICMGGLFASSNRSGFVAMAVGLLYIVVIRPIWVFVAARPIVRHGLLVLVVGGMLAASFSLVGQGSNWVGRLSQAGDRLVSIFDFDTQEVAKLNGRTALWAFAWERVTSSPATLFFGTGDEPTRSDVWNGEDSGLYLPLHNIYLFFFYSHGIFALIFFLALFTVITFATFFLSKWSGLTGQVATGLHISCIALAINGIGVDWISFASTFTAGVFLMLSTYVLCRYYLQIVAQHEHNFRRRPVLQPA